MPVKTGLPKFAQSAAKAVAKSDRSYLLSASTRRLSAFAGFVRSYFELIETKDLTCNAQFNFCLLFYPELSRGFCDRSELAHSAPAITGSLRCSGSEPSRSRVTNSRIKLSKIAALTNFRATKNSISVPTLILRPLSQRIARSLPGQD